MIEDIEHMAALAASGDAAAFDVVCHRLADDVWRYCYAILRDRERAFDASQDAFLRATTGILRFRGDSSIRTWMMVIARRAVADMLRRDDRRRDRTTLEADPDGAVTSGTDAVELEQLIAALSPERRQAFVLTQVIGLSYQEAADVAEVAVGTIRSRVARARQELTRALTHHSEKDEPYGR